MSTAIAITMFDNTLGSLIDFLEAQDQTLVVRYGFHRPHSYRGYYEDVAFEPADNVTVASMLACAKEALGKTYDGYKGGKYTMERYTNAWLSPYGQSGGDTLGPTLLRYMIEFAVLTHEREVAKSQATRPKKSK